MNVVCHVFDVLWFVVDKYISMFGNKGYREQQGIFKET